MKVKRVEAEFESRDAEAAKFEVREVHASRQRCESGRIGSGRRASLIEEQEIKKELMHPVNEREQRRVRVRRRETTHPENRPSTRL